MSENQFARIIIWMLTLLIYGGTVGHLCATFLGSSFWSFAAAIVVSASGGAIIGTIFPPVLRTRA